MTKQYWINDFFVDLTRNQITQNKQPQIIPPKALAVLTYLAENQGRVVSQDELLDKVWAGTIVSPNTLQRSIAHLRKALGDDGKVQSIIKTHAKQGYSLECDVRWNDSTHPDPVMKAPLDSEVSESSDQDTYGLTTESKSSSQILKLLSGIAGVIIIGFLINQFLQKPASSSMTIDSIHSLTATDDKEFDPSYTPDGQHIVFHRYRDKLCVNHLWAKNADTQEETQLTRDWGAYGRHSFSKDGKEMVFLATQACDQPSNQKDCYDLVRLDFHQALESPQQPEVILQCQNSIIKKPIWLNNNDVVLKQLISNRWKLVRYSIDDNASSDLFEVNNGNIIDYAYSASEDLLAVITIHEDGQHYIEMLEPDGRIVSSHLIDRPSEIPLHRELLPNFDPHNQQLVFSTGRQLFTLSYDGKVSKINSAFADKVMQPEFHPDGKKLLMIKGPYDSDVVQLPWSQFTDLTSFETLDPKSPGFNSFERTNLGEGDSIFQPGGDLIAFWSERSGDSQIWVSDGNTPQQLTRFPIDNSIQGFDWAKDGESLLVSANNVLTQVFLDSTAKRFDLDFPVVRLYQWDSENNSALVMTRNKGVYQFLEYDLNQSKVIKTHDKPTLWGLKTQDGRLVYKDYKGQFWQTGPIEDLPITSLDPLRHKNKSFVLHKNTIYAINTDNQLWSYDLQTGSFKVLAEVDKAVDNITDVNETHILLTVQVAAKKEVVELTIRDE